MLELTLRVTISLAVVFGLMAGMARLARRPLRRRSCELDIVARQQLTRSSAIAAIRAYDKLLIIGVTDHGVNLLTEADPAAAGMHSGSAADDVEIDGQPAPAANLVPRSRGAGRLAGSALSVATWKQAIDYLRERTVRRS